MSRKTWSVWYHTQLKSDYGTFWKKYPQLVCIDLKFTGYVVLLRMFFHSLLRRASLACHSNDIYNNVFVEG